MSFELICSWGTFVSVSLMILLKYFIGFKNLFGQHSILKLILSSYALFMFYQQSKLLSLISSPLNYLGKVLLVIPQINSFASRSVHLLVQSAVIPSSLTNSFLCQIGFLGTLQSA